MNTGSTSSNKTKAVIAVIIMVLVLVVFIWMMFLLLAPIDEAQRKEVIPDTTPTPEAPAEAAPPQLPQTGVTQ